MGSQAVRRGRRKSAPIEVVDVRRVDNLGNIRAFLSLCIGGMTIHGAKIVQQSEQRPWLAMPDRQWTAPDGKIRYSPVIELSASLKKRVNDAALGGWENALTAEPAA